MSRSELFLADYKIGRRCLETGMHNYRWFGGPGSKYWYSFPWETQTLMSYHHGRYRYDSSEVMTTPYNTTNG